MNVSQISYKPNMINNQNRYNQNVSFKASEGELLVQMLERNKGQLPSEKLDDFIINNFHKISIFRRGMLKELLEKPIKYIAGLTATIATLTATNKTLEEQNKELQKRVNYFVDATQVNNINVELTESERKYAEMQKVCHVLDELKIPYAVEKNNNEGLLIIDASTVGKKEMIAEKLGKKINFYDYVGTINGDVDIYNSYYDPHLENIQVDLGNVHTINGDLTVKGFATKSYVYTYCRANKLVNINGNLVVGIGSQLNAPSLKKIKDDCDIVDATMTTSNLESVGHLYVCGDYHSFLKDSDIRDFSNLKHAKSITYKACKLILSPSLICNKINHMPWSDPD